MLDQQPGRILTLCFRGTVTRRGTSVLIAPKLDVPCRTKQIRITFEPQTGRTVEALFIAAQDNTIDYTTVAAQTNLFAGIAQNQAIVGDAQPIILMHEIELHWRPIYFKIALNNTDGAAHTIDAQITVQLMHPD